MLESTRERERSSNTETKADGQQKEGHERESGLVPPHKLRAALTQSGPIASSAALGLQRLCGNRATSRMIADARRGQDPRPPSAAPIQAKMATNNPSILTPPDGAARGAQSGARSRMPEGIQAKMEASFGASFSDVTINTASQKAAGRGALAVTEGNQIDFAPGQFQPNTGSGQALLGHELTHVLQQRAGRKTRAGQPKKDRSRVEAALDIDYDAEAEAQADECGQRAARGERAVVPGAPAAAPQAAPSGSAPIQPKLGFEIEMLVLIDQANRPIPEKRVVGNYGPHLKIDVDQGPQIAAVTQALPQANTFDIPLANQATYHGQYTVNVNGHDYHHTTFLNVMGDNNLWDDLAEVPLKTSVTELMKLVRTIQRAPAQDQDALRAELRTQQNFEDLFDLVWTVVNDLQTQAYNNSPQTYAKAYTRLHNPFIPATVNTVLAEVKDRMSQVGNRALKEAFVQSCISSEFVHTATNTEVTGRTATGQPGMGGTRYASIVELGTEAYSPETNSGRTKILEAMQDAVELADLIEAANPRANHLHLNLLGNNGKFRGVPNDVFIGNPRQKKQTTDASIQSTFGVDLAHLASFIKSTMGDGAQAFYRVKHDADQTVHNADNMLYRAEQQILAAVDDATAILNGLHPDEDLPNLRGLLILLCQYLRLGKYAYNNNAFGLDKNMTALLSRTDLAKVRENMPQDEKNYLMDNTQAIKAAVLNRTGRLPNSTVLTNAQQNQAYAMHRNNITVGPFIDNVFTQYRDGLTDEFGGLMKLNVEDIHPYGSARQDHVKKGPVFELRNLVQPAGDNERFPRTQWLGLAQYLITILQTLHGLSDADAMTDRRVVANAPNAQNPGQHSATQAENQSWKQ